MATLSLAIVSNKVRLRVLLSLTEIFEIIPLKGYYSLSNSQGDGFCFIGDFTFKGYNVKITHKNRYYHKKSTEIIIYDENGNSDFKGYEEIEKEFKEIYYSICDKCEKYGYNLIEEENSEYRISDYYICNEITFRENGEIENE
jgi:hypothetical protein